MSLRKLLVASLLVLVAPLAGAQTDSVASLQRFLDQTRSLTAKFDQTVTDQRQVVVEQSSGTLYLERPGKFRWSYVKPYIQEIVGNDGKVWIYDGDLEQVSIKYMDGQPQDSPAVLLTSTRPLGELFEVRDMGARDGLDWVELTPFNKDSTFLAMRVGVKGSVLGAMELADTFGQLTRLEFATVEQNPTLAPGLFVFEPPAGVDVIEEKRAPKR